jgi:tetratricopeptide (TPR) repeat protein
MIRLAHAVPLAFGVFLLSGCPAVLRPTLHEATVKAGDLPEGVDELIKYADEEQPKDSAAASENVIIAVDRGLAKDGKSYELLWRGARACAWLTEEFEDKTQRASYAQKGIDLSRRAVEIDPKRVEGHYYLGINIGQSATTKTVGAYMMVPKVLKAADQALKIDAKFDHAGPAAADQALKIDAKFDHAGPARLLGNVYAKAPGAAGGDIDEGIKYLSLAVQLAPDYPQNHLHYGEALAKDEKYDESDKQYRLVLDAVSTPEWAHRLERWKHDAQAGLQKNATKRSE